MKQTILELRSLIRASLLESSSMDGEVDARLELIKKATTDEKSFDQLVQADDSSAINGVINTIRREDLAVPDYLLKWAMADKTMSDDYFILELVECNLTPEQVKAASKVSNAFRKMVRDPRYVAQLWQQYLKNNMNYPEWLTILAVASKTKSNLAAEIQKFCCQTRSFLFAYLVCGATTSSKPFGGIDRFIRIVHAAGAKFAAAEVINPVWLSVDMTDEMTPELFKKIAQSGIIEEATLMDENVDVDSTTTYIRAIHEMDPSLTAVNFAYRATKNWLKKPLSDVMKELYDMTGYDTFTHLDEIMDAMKMVPKDRGDLWKFLSYVVAALGGGMS